MELQRQFLEVENKRASELDVLRGDDADQRRKLTAEAAVWEGEKIDLQHKMRELNRKLEEQADDLRVLQQQTVDLKGERARLKQCIVDKGVQIPPEEQIGYDLEQDRERFTLTARGIVVMNTPGGSSTENARAPRCELKFLTAYSYRHLPIPRSVTFDATWNRPSSGTSTPPDSLPFRSGQREPSRKRWLSHSGVPSAWFATVRRSRMTSRGDRVVPAAFAGHATWQRPHFVHASKSSSSFQVKSVMRV